MDRLHSNPELRVPLDLKDEEVEAMTARVQKELGSNFSLVAHLPRNVGVTGDAGVWGNTVLITAHDQASLEAIHADHDRLERFSTSLSNEFGVTRVLIDIAAQSTESILETPQIEFVAEQR